jgi:hypothetical protein
MSKPKKGEGRGLEHLEVALMKRMILDRFPRDRIMSFFVRPGRVISPAAKSEVEKGKIGRDVEPATPDELARFVSSRLNEIRPFNEYAGPLSPSRVREVISLTRDAQESLPGFENQFSEYKEVLPTDRLGRIRIAKVAASFANARGGYVFFGISDDRAIVGIEVTDQIERQFQSIFQCVNESFTPAFEWDHALVEISGKTIAAIYVYEAENKPIICTREHNNDIHKGHIYLRYSASSRLIEPGDLLSMLGERDRRMMSRGIPQAPSASLRPRKASKIASKA